MKKLRLKVAASCFVLSLLAAGAEGPAFGDTPGRQADPPRRPGDVVTAERARMVYVTGGVRRPVALYLKDPLTIKMALAMAGGLRRDADPEKIIIYRHAAGSDAAATMLKVNLKAVRREQAEDIKLQADDIIWVPCKSCGSDPAAARLPGLERNPTGHQVRVIY
jgi:hypothetical protein